jgi:hypothetical protein
MQQTAKKFWKTLYENAPDSAKVPALEFYGNLHQFHEFSRDGETYLIQKHPFYNMLTGFVLALHEELVGGEELLQASKGAIKELIEEAEGEQT